MVTFGSSRSLCLLLLFLQGIDDGKQRAAPWINPITWSEPRSGSITISVKSGNPFLIGNKEEPVTEAAMTVGFDSLSHFNVIFRSFMGVSPRDYGRLKTQTPQTGTPALPTSGLEK